MNLNRRLELYDTDSAIYTNMDRRLELYNMDSAVYTNADRRLELYDTDLAVHTNLTDVLDCIHCHEPTAHFCQLPISANCLFLIARPVIQRRNYG